MIKNLIGLMFHRILNVQKMKIKNLHVTSGLNMNTSSCVVNSFWGSRTRNQGYWESWT